ncbi:MULTISPECIES: ABC transporter substrate-binding protein [unclassified Rathayibacter]|uniref:ABC transporter substrate-binding protein n=1 Tax=unclassified Rathayibacter TaxID=2609250 RepID=UPI000F4C868F|nr:MULTISPECIES: extracellular solute-binding protein [unclassified Rathayibacter]ROP49765.1 alpha-glucoside transport system substrate-binding protein [Rathayibacter sp. PhB186]ROS51741.1 alpha-glucoside transport system substrate-binding protein [Rathayibacter sp. PhB185]TCL86081.1 carbohydrate ABC transporter substrate-binding protein (CUT1 family) [Rathayibacter sp. PhB192]TCM31902.1 carbohydrate ABC transporter substrate-binding protein (CUT1 family) [Rathayibacter sp. PhB179]
MRSSLHRRLTLPVAVLAAAGIALAGCSSSSDPNDPNAGGGASSGGAAGDGSVTVYGTINGDEATLLEQSWADWEKESGIDIKYTGDKGFEQQIGIKVQGGDVPDLAIFPQPGLLADTVASGKVKELPEGALANVKQNWSEDWQKYGQVDGTQYGAPLMASVKGYVWYSPAKFKEWGVSVPTTWDEMEALGKTIAEKSGGPSWCAGFASDAASGWPGTDWIEDAVLRESGPDVYDSWVAGDTPFTDPKIKAAFDSVGSILLDPTLVNAGYGDVSSINSTAFGDVAQNIANGSCALTHQASFFEGFLTGADATVAEDGDVWAFLTPPIKADDDQAVTGGGEFVAAFADDADTAKVQEYLASADWANSRVKLGGVISANTGLDPANASSDLLRSSISILQDPGTTFRFDASDLMPKAVGSDSFFKGMVDWIDGSSTDQVLDTIQAGYTS